MDASSSVADHHSSHGPEADHGHDHHELGFWRKYIFSTDHKVIGIQYGICGLIFLFAGFSLMMLMRFQLAYPGHALPADRQLPSGAFSAPAACRTAKWRRNFTIR